MKICLIITIFSACLFAACKTATNAKSSKENICNIARVHYGGDPRADGTGWVLAMDSINTVFETAENLDSAYLQEGLTVDVCYYVTDKDVVCFCTKPKKIIHLTSIKRL